MHIIIFMEASFKQDNKLNKAERYQTFLTQFAPLIEGEKNEISVLANTCAALKEAFDFFWVGFYLVHNGELHLGPFQGSVACYRIKKDAEYAVPPGRKHRRRSYPT